MDHAQMMAMQPDELVKLLQQGAPAQAQQAEQPAPEADAAAPEQPEVEQADEHTTPRDERQAEQALEAERENPRADDRAATEEANKTEALRQEREIRRQHEERARQAETRAAEAERLAEQYRQWASNPDALRAHLAAIAPQQAQAAQPPDYDLDPQGAIQHHLAPLQQQLQAVQAELAHTKQQAALQQHMGALGQKYGQDFHPTLAAFDQANGHLAHLDPEARYLMARGYMATQQQAPDPAAEEARINALASERAKTLAEEAIAKALASGKPVRGIPTLGGAQQTKPQQGAPDLASMRHGDLVSKSPAELQALLRQQYTS